MNLFISFHGQIEKIENDYSNFVVSEINGIDVRDENIRYTIERYKLRDAHALFEGAPVNVNLYRNNGHIFTEIVLSDGEQTERVIKKLK